MTDINDERGGFFATIVVHLKYQSVSIKAGTFWGLVVMSSILLVCAVVASLAVGVYVAQGLCMLMFSIFRMRVKQAAATRMAKTAVVALDSSGS